MGKGAQQKKENPKKKPVQPEEQKLKGNFLHNRNYQILAGIVILGLFLRLFDLSRKPLWLDEASTNYLTTQPDVLAVISAATNDHHAPLHFITVWLIKSVGSSEFLLRLPSAIAGALTVLVIFFIAKELYSNEAGLIAAALLAVSPYHLQYSQEARMYGMVVLFVSLALFFFLRSLRTGNLYDWLLFGCACALSFSTHFYAAFAILAVIIGYGIIRLSEFSIRKDTGGTILQSVSVPHDFRHFLAGVVLAAVLVLPVLGSFINQSGYFVSQTNVKLSAFEIPYRTFFYFSDYSDGIAVLFFCLMLVGIFMLWRQKRTTAVALAGIMVIPMISGMYLASVIPFDVRYHLYLISIFLALVSIPLAWLSLRIHAGYGTLSIITLILLLSALPLSAYYTEPFVGQDWRAASVTLKEHAKPGDAVVPLPWNNYLPLSFYYNNETYGTHYRNFALNESGFHELDNEQGDVDFIITLSDLNWKGEQAVVSSVTYLNNHTRVLSGKNMYDILVAQKIS
jgi:mannosyltransferase